ncbi:hypothetical protein GCK72_019912 [Caenorhabditis remanei]|uniref:receptor protein-tyrosine kinase n=1 Tax=Caenorhabditis remanei TaxID=31234 RepID=A0A6A5GF81_CAERE|nr:hypothetical protein GCK72_019912 [Caenorhabditis remanei]KAF1753356.1 hypothetical protein GCK72_019912 [Caenorhabditis remanei]
MVFCIFLLVLTTSISISKQFPIPEKQPSNFVQSQKRSASATNLTSFSNYMQWFMSRGKIEFYLLAYGFLVILAALCYYSWRKWNNRTVLRQRKRAPSNKYIKMKPMSSKNRRKLHKQELLSRLLNNSLEFDPEFEIDTKNLTIGEELGGGNFGIVHKAKLYCPNLKTKTNSFTVAVKRAKYSLDQTEKCIRQKMIFDELKVMCAIKRHPNVLILLGGATINPSDTMIISEFADNGTLLEFLRKFQNGDAFNDQLLYSDQQSGHKKKTDCYTTSIEINDSMEFLSTVDLVSFAYQIANGMKYLAEIPCVHRDLALRNVFLLGNKVIRIGDFGLTRKHENKGYYRIASPDIGLPFLWIAPESFENWKFTEKTDIWSFGVCMYELFTLGKTPYEDLKGMLVLDYLKSGGRLSEPEYCHPKIYEFMNLCWATDPLFRPNFKMCTEFFKEHLSNINIQAYNHLEEKLESECQYQDELINWIRTTET